MGQGETIPKFYDTPFPEFHLKVGVDISTCHRIIEADVSIFYLSCYFKIAVITKNCHHRKSS